MNWFLVIVACVVSFTTVVVGWKLLHMYLDPQDVETDHCVQSGLIFTLKIIAVAAISLAAWVNLLLPYDVANRKDPTVRESTGGGLDVAFMWMLTLWSVCAMCVVVLPLAFFIHEAWDPSTEPNRDSRLETDEAGCHVLCRQCCDGSCWAFMSIFVFICLVLILYFGTGGKSELELTRIKCPGSDIRLTPCVLTRPGDICPLDLPVATVVAEQNKCEYSDEVLKFQVSVFVYVVGLLTAIGWVLFVMFAGVGLFYLPVDAYQSWFDNRLEKMERDSVHSNRIKFRDDAEKMMKKFKLMKAELEKGKKQSQKDMTRLADCAERLQKAHARNERYVKESAWAWLSSPFVIWGRFVLFLICCVWSALWFLHMIVYTATKTHPFLNDAFEALDSAFSLLGIMFYGSFSYYLLWATVDGCTHIGLMILCIRIHPMKRGETLLSSFLFNCILILYASVACVSYCALSFREYAANTVVDTLYGGYINKLEGLRYIMEYFQYALFGVAFLAGTYNLCCVARRSFSEVDQPGDSLSADINKVCGT